MSNSIFRNVAATLGSALLLFVGRAEATTITTTSTTTWKSAAYITGSNSVVDFYPVLASSYNTSTGITLAPTSSTIGFTFTGSDNGSYFLVGDRYNKTLSSSTDAGAYLNIAFSSSSENAFLIGTNASSSKPLTVALSDGESFSVSTTVFGVSISHPISWVELSAAPGSQALISDFWFGASSLAQDAPNGGTPAPTAPTPEPATILMICAGGALLLTGSGKWKVAGQHA